MVGVTVKIEEIFRTASLCRNFELYTYKLLEEKVIRVPTYLSAGQEMISATLSHWCKEKNIKPDLFIQHRGHSTYLSFDGDPYKLARELLGKKDGCSNGMAGSASISCKDINLYGHSGLMGDQVPIAVGSCYAKKKPTIVFLGDGAAEEDYVLGALGWASTKNIPILFVVEDNNLSILTEKKVRRSWDINKVSSSMGIYSTNLSDDPFLIMKYTRDLFTGFAHPTLLNIHTRRKFWHAGAGTDGPVPDRYETIRDQDLGELGKEIELEQKKIVEDIWDRALKTP